MDFRLWNVRRRTLQSGKINSQAVSAGSAGPIISASAECMRCGCRWEATRDRSKGGLDASVGGTRVSCPNCKHMSIVANADLG